MNKAKRAPKPEAAKATQDKPQSHKPNQTVEPPNTVAIVPEKLVREQRGHSTQIIEALTKTAIALSGKEGAADQVAIMERLWNMQKEAEDRQAAREFGIAKSALAMELPPIPKNHKIEFLDKNKVQRETPYADRADIENVLDPLCRKHGFSKEYSTDTVDGKAAQVLTVRHVSGHTVVYHSPYMPLDSSGSKNNNQAAGSTAEYGRRYALVGAFNIIGVDKDDDGSMAASTSEAAGDKFTARVQEDTGAPKTAIPPVNMTLPEAAAALESKIRNCPQKDRGALLMKHIKIIGEMEKDAHWHEKAAELRRLCEEVPNAAA